MKLELPLKTISLTNTHQHWRKIASLHKKQKGIIYLSLVNKPLPLPCSVTLTRVSPRSLDDDNLPSAFKAIRDQIADLLIPGLPPGRADSDPRIEWIYKQKKGRLGVEVEICPTVQQ